jgi:hypothetical protein
MSVELISYAACSCSLDAAASGILRPFRICAERGSTWPGAD